jgi:hypothetical protein
MIKPTTTRGAPPLLFAALLAATPALAEMSAEELAKLAQNPVGNLISVPFQNNTNLNFGPEKDAERPQHPAGDSDLGQRRVEHHHPHHRAGDLDAFALPGRRPDQRHRRHGIHGLPLAGQARQLHLGSRAGGADFRPTAIRNSATRTGDSARRSWRCTSKRAIPGSTACWSTTSGRSPATSRAARTTTA